MATNSIEFVDVNTVPVELTLGNTSKNNGFDCQENLSPLRGYVKNEIDCDAPIKEEPSDSEDYNDINQKTFGEPYIKCEPMPIDCIIKCEVEETQVSCVSENKLATSHQKYSSADVKCHVATCKNSAIKTKGLKIIYHSFPKDPTLKKRWMNLCRRAGKWNADNCRICSIHFKKEDYKRDLQNGLSARKKLKDSALPSLNLPVKMPTTDSAKCRLATNKIGKRKKLVAIIIDKANKSNIPEAAPIVNSAKINVQLAASELAFKNYRRLVGDYQKLEKEFETIKTTNRRKIKNLKSMVHYYKMRCLSVESKCEKQQN